MGRVGRGLVEQLEIIEERVHKDCEVEGALEEHVSDQDHNAGRRFAHPGEEEGNSHGASHR